MMLKQSNKYNLTHNMFVSDINTCRIFITTLIDDAKFIKYSFMSYFYIIID